MIALSCCPGSHVSSGPGPGERLSAWPASCTGSVVSAPTARSSSSRSGSASSSASSWWSGSFILNGDPTIKQFGVGLSVTVLLAGAMVLSLAPAMLTLFGGATWWLPGWLARVLPHVDIEAQPGPPPDQEPAGEAAPGTAAMRAASRWRR